MPEYKFTVTHTVSDQFIFDILTNAVEGGMMSWAYIEDLKRKDADDLSVVEFRVSDAEWEPCDEDDDPDGNCRDCQPEFAPRLKVNAETVVRGLQRLLAGEVRIDDGLLEQITRSVAEDDCDIDAIASDCIIQAGMLGKIVFG